MPWQHDPAERRKSDATYKDPEYKRNRPLAWKRAGGRCELITAGRRCSSRMGCQVDHITPVSQGGTHHLDNLQVLCETHHRQKTAHEGRGYRRGRQRQAAPPLVTRTEW